MLGCGLRWEGWLGSFGFMIRGVVAEGEKRSRSRANASPYRDKTAKGWGTRVCACRTFAVKKRISPLRIASVEMTSLFIGQRKTAKEDMDTYGRMTQGPLAVSFFTACRASLAWSRGKTLTWGLMLIS